MANYCYNRVEIRGDKEILESICEKLEKYNETTYFSEFGDIVLNQYDQKKDYKSIYSIYGTKWWDFDFELEQDDLLVISGDSAWSPPLFLIQKISEIYELDCYIEYSEPGMDFAGEISFHLGEEVDTWEGSYQAYEFRNEGHERILEQIIEYSEPKCIEDIKENISNDIISEIKDEQILDYLKNINLHLKFEKTKCNRRILK